MAFHELGNGTGLTYEHTPPSGERGCTFVFFNALTGDLAMWQGAIIPALQKAGHGALVYNMRGQPDSPFPPGTELDQALIVSDALSLLKAVAPSRPVYVGLSIGGLFALDAHLQGAEAVGMVLINTLREECARLRWINDAVGTMAKVGGLPLLGDLMTPMIWGHKWLGENRGNFFNSESYTPIDQASGHYSMLKNANKANWDIPYEKITVPVLVLSGLRDRVFYEPDVVDKLTGRMPAAKRLDIPHAGHMLPVEAPDEVIKAMVEFGGGI